MRKAGPFSTFVWFIPLMAAMGLCRDFFCAASISPDLPAGSALSSYSEGVASEAADLNLDAPNWGDPLFCLNNGLRESDSRVVTRFSAPQTPSLRFVIPFPVSESGACAYAAGDFFSADAASLPRYLVFRSLLI